MDDYTSFLIGLIFGGINFGILTYILCKAGLIKLKSQK